MHAHEIRERFDALNGRTFRNGRFPAIPGKVERTGAGTLYLTRPGVILLGRTESCMDGLELFLEGFGDTFRSPEGRFPYLDDIKETPLSDGVQLSKTLGQLCYMSLDGKGTSNAKAADYFENIKSSKHGSVVEHPSYTMLAFGGSRSFTHELVRHRIAGFSQVSQRYVGGSILRFVERPEYVGDEELHALFEKSIDEAADRYEKIGTILEARRANDSNFKALKRAEKRKAVQQVARAGLPNETEAPIGFTMNVRAFRHATEQRVSQHAEPEIRRIMYQAFLCAAMCDPELFTDYTIADLPDGSSVVSTPHVKI